jgi:hypothetical protein
LAQDAVDKKASPEAGKKKASRHQQTSAHRDGDTDKKVAQHS